MGNVTLPYCIFITGICDPIQVQFGNLTYSKSPVSNGKYSSQTIASLECGVGIQAEPVSSVTCGIVGQGIFLFPGWYRFLSDQQRWLPAIPSCTGESYDFH